MTSTCRWCTITGSTSGVSRISHSRRTTCPSCAQPVDGVLTPTSTGPRLLRLRGSPEVGGKSRTTRRAHRRMRPVRVMETSVGDFLVLMIQDPSAADGAVVFDCRPLLLPVCLDISGVDLSSGRPPATSASVEVLPSEHGPSFGGGGDSDGLIIPELGVAPLVDPGTDLEDETSCRRRMVRHPLMLVSRFLVIRLQASIWSWRGLSWSLGSYRRW